MLKEMNKLFPIELTSGHKEGMKVYKETFNEDFPAEFVAADTKGRIARINECLATNEPVPESEYAIV